MDPDPPRPRLLYPGRMASLPARAAILLGLLSTQTGCWGWLRADAGFTTSTTLKSGRQGAAVGADFAFGEERVPVTFDVGLRAKGTERAGDAAVFAGMLFLPKADPVSFYLLAGSNVLQLGGADGAVSFGAFTPSAEAGIAIDASYKRRRGNDLLEYVPRLVTIGSRIEYDLRFTPQKHEGFWTVNVGYAFGMGRDR